MIMKRLVVFIALFLVALGVNVYAQNGGTITKVEIDGNRVVEDEAILRVLNTQPGDPYSEERVSQDLQKIIGMGYFEDVTIDVENAAGGGKVVRFIVKERPAVAQVEFTGNRLIETDDLVEAVDYTLYSILDTNKILDAMDAIRELYKQKGFYNVKVAHEEVPIEGREVILRFKITEGERVYIKKIEFIGNKAFDNDDLEDEMELETKGLLAFITDSGILKQEKLDQDVQKLNDFYHNRGYLNAQVGRPEVRTEDDGLTLVFRIVEGPRYKVGKLSIESKQGDLIKPEKEILDELNLPDEEYVNMEVLTNDLRDIKLMYADKGYAFANVYHTFKPQASENVVDVTYSVERKKKVAFERISITGNDRTRDHVIRRELKVAEGDQFSAERLRKSNMNLHRLGYFDDVEIITSKGSRDDLMNLKIKVKERPTGAFSVGAGYSSYNQLMGKASISESNLFGTGRKIALEASVGSRSDDYTFTFIEPWLFDMPLSLAYKVYRKSFDYDEYFIEALGTSVGLNYEIVENYWIGTEYALEQADVSDIALNSAQAIQDMAGTSVSSGVTLYFTRDTRNAVFLPTEGSRNSFSVTYLGGPFGGDHHSTKYIVNSGWYIPTGLDETTIFLHGKAGYVTEDKEGGLPVYNKFFLGGMMSVRGFEWGSLTPRDPVTNEKVGGEKMAYFNAELIFPIVKESGFMGVLFYDTGNVWRENDSWFSDMRQSFGGGFRFYSPMGPLRLEYARIIDPRRGEPTENWEFSVGTMF